MQLNWQFFLRSDKVPSHLNDVVKSFDKHINEIASHNHSYNSIEVLELLRIDLEEIGYQIEKSKKASDKIKFPVLFERNEALEKSFDADGFNKETKTVIEVEAGRGVTNYQFLKDLFQACMMHDVLYLVVAVRNVYAGKKDFEVVNTFFETLYASNRISLPLKVILIIGILDE